MSEDRIKEIRKFTEDFKRKLTLAKERYEQSKSINIKAQKNKESNNFILINKSHRKKKHRKRYVYNFLLKIIIYY